MKLLRTSLLAAVVLLLVGAIVFLRTLVTVPLPPIDGTAVPNSGVTISLDGPPTGRVFDDLEPVDDILSASFSEDYYKAVGLGLLGDEPYRMCQLVAMPAFKSEWAVYIVKARAPGSLLRASAPVLLVAARFRKPLWPEGQTPSKDGRSYSFEFDRFGKDDLRGRVDVWKTPLTAATTEALQAVWTQTMVRVRYSDHATGGFDGVAYHVSHWSQDVGFRSGHTWSPRRGTRNAALVELAEHMLEAAQKPSASAERDLQDGARALLARIPQK